MTGRGIGDNGGPPLDPDVPDEGASWRLWCWKRAHRRAWKTPPREIALRRLAAAEAAGVTYRQYTLEIMERGVYLPPVAASGARVLEQRRPRARPGSPRHGPALARDRSRPGADQPSRA